MLSLLGLLILLLLVVLLLFQVRGGRSLPLRPRSRILLVTAHPDDEAMFFCPMIRGLRLAGHRIFILCISNGNYYGLGRLRCAEIRRAVTKLGISSSDVTVLDYEIFPDGGAWEKSSLSHVIITHAEVLGADCIVTFDGYGVSGHDNHTACFHAVQDAYTRGIVPEDVQTFVLDSVSLARKYVGMFDAACSVTTSPFRYFARGRDVYACWRAMWAHRSQFVWFRILYLMFSRYVYINSLRRIAPQQRFPVGKKSKVT